MEAIISFFTSFVDIIVSVINLLITLVESILWLIGYLPVLVASVTASFGFAPTFLIPFLTASVALLVVFCIIRLL